jgi:hypothetical protein
VKPAASTDEQSESRAGHVAAKATGRSFNQIDTYVYERLRELRIKRAGRQLDSRGVSRWTREYFWNLGLHRPYGTIKYPEAIQYRWSESPPASRVRQIRTHGFHGGRIETRRQDGRK